MKKLFINTGNIRLQTCMVWNEYNSTTLVHVHCIELFDWI